MNLEQEIFDLKRKLYRAYLISDITRLSENDVDILNLLSKDREIQNLFTRNSQNVINKLTENKNERR
jgi:hypothetical protein